MRASKPLRILHVIDYFYPELGYQETYLSLAEAKHGYDVYVLTSNLVDKITYMASRDFIGSRKKSTGISVERGIKTIRLPAFRLPIINNLFLLGLEKTIATLKPDIIICHGITFLTSIRMARLKNQLSSVKLIFDDHMTYNATRGGIFYHIYSLFKLAFIPAILKSANRIVAVTYETRDFMERIYGIPKEKIEIITLGVDTTLFRRDPKAREEIRAKYGIRHDDIVFIYAGKITPEKGPHLLIQAAFKIIRENPNVVTMLVGGGNDHYKILLTKTISLSGFSHRIVFVSPMPNEELFRYYSAADVGIWPLQCSISMLEAMSCGLPVVISDRSGALERIAQGNGLMYREGDVDDLAKKMEIMLNAETRRIMGLNAVKFARDNDWNSASRKFLASANTQDATQGNANV